MASEPHDAHYAYGLYDDQTDPRLRSMTRPLPGEYLSPDPWSRRASRGMRAFFEALIFKIRQLLSLVFTIVTLLLLCRFLLKFFGITSSLFAQWIYMLSAPLVFPFDNLLPILSYGMYHIEVTTLVAILVYGIARMLLGKFLNLFVA